MRVGHRKVEDEINLWVVHHRVYVRRTDIKIARTLLCGLWIEIATSYDFQAAKQGGVLQIRAGNIATSHNSNSQFFITFRGHVD